MLVLTQMKRLALKKYLKKSVRNSVNYNPVTLIIKIHFLTNCTPLTDNLKKIYVLTQCL